jgi:hypothetical protein
MKPISPLTERDLGTVAPDAQTIHPEILTLTAHRVNALARIVAISFISSTLHLQ